MKLFNFSAEWAGAKTPKPPIKTDKGSNARESCWNGLRMGFFIMATNLLELESLDN